MLRTGLILLLVLAITGFVLPAAAEKSPAKIAREAAKRANAERVVRDPGLRFEVDLPDRWKAWRVEADKQVVRLTWRGNDFTLRHIAGAQDIDALTARQEDTVEGTVGALFLVDRTDFESRGLPARISVYILDVGYTDGGEPVPETLLAAIVAEDEAITLSGFPLRRPSMTMLEEFLNGIRFTTTAE